MSSKCPHCHQQAQPIKTKGRLFCSNCHIHLYTKSQTQTQQTKSTFQLMRTLLKALLKGFVIALFWLPIWLLLDYFHLDDWIFDHTLLLLSFVCVVFMFIHLFEKVSDNIRGNQPVYQCGVDYLPDYQKDDSVTYKLVRGQTMPTCPECGSFRMVDLFWYKRRYLEAHQSLPEITTEEAVFVGCLHCHARYKILPKSIDYSKAIVFSCILAVAVILFLSYQILIKPYFINDSVLTAISLFLGGWFYGFLISLPRQSHQQTHQAMVKLTKV